ncbi:MAG: alpha/beta fold hydrolase [Elusimicrobia bacterium]|nr:alpha/beta fold hydrolase [Elusimicrobiota bacterium]
MTIDRRNILQRLLALAFCAVQGTAYANTMSSLWDQAAPAFAPVPDVGNVQPVASPENPEALYRQGVAALRAYVAGKRARNVHNHPFDETFLHDKRTPRSVLMIHGFSDSPYYMRALADVFYAEGYNVVGILLPGHGTKPEDLLNVDYREWKAETRKGLEIARALGEEVSIAGFSTGGALAVNVIATAAADRSIRFGDVFLISPLFRVSDWKTPFSCSETLARKFEQFPWTDDVNESCTGDPAEAPPQRKGVRQPEVHEHRYTNKATNGVCQCYKLTVENNMLRVPLYAAIRERRIGVFTAWSMADKIVIPEATSEFVRGLPGSIRRGEINYPTSQCMKHADVPRPETNSKFGELKDAIIQFIRKPR